MMMQRYTRALARRLGGESGIALIAAISVLLIVALLATAAVTVSMDTASSTTRDEHSKAALEAAESGLRVATYRLNMLKPSQGNCIDETSVVEPNEAIVGYCSATTSEPLGNNASFRYWTTPELRAGMQCVGKTLTVSEEAREKKESIEQRCVTAEGVADGIHARVQARVATFTAQPLFPFPGIIGQKLVKISGKTVLNTAVGSNGKIISEGESSSQYSGYCELGAHASGFEGNNEINRPCYTLKQRSEAEGEFTLTAVEPGTSAEESPDAEECSIEVPPKKNCDVRITNGIKKAKHETYSEPFDEVAIKPGNVTFTPSSSETEPRFMSLKGGGSWTMGAGVYNFCNFVAEGGAITIAAGAKAMVYIEAPESEEPGSGCPAGSGKLEFRGGTVINNLSEDPTALEFFVYGKGPVVYEGKSNTVQDLSMTLYAPNASVTMKGTGTFTGGIVGSELYTEGEFAFQWRKEEEALKLVEHGETTASYYRTAWTQCSPEAPAESPAEGC